MIEDLNIYMETFQREAMFEKCMLETVIENMIEKLSTKKKLAVSTLEMHLDLSARFVLGDPTDLRHLFYHLV